MKKKRKKSTAKSPACSKAGKKLRVRGVRKRKRRIGCNNQMAGVSVIGSVRRKRKRRIGVVENAKSAIMDTGVIVAGAVAGSFVINKAIDLGKTVFDASKYEGYIQTALGIAGATLIKNQLAKKAMQGVAAAGALKVLLQFIPANKSVAGVKLISGVLQGGSKIGAISDELRTLINNFYNYPTNLSDNDLNTIFNSIGSSGLGITCDNGYKNLQIVRQDVLNEINKRESIRLQSQILINNQKKLQDESCINVPELGYINPNDFGGSLYNTNNQQNVEAPAAPIMPGQSEAEYVNNLSNSQKTNYYNNRYGGNRVYGTLGVIR